MACGVRPGDHVIDIGCGTGQTTRQAARLAVAGSTLGIDLSAPAVAQARRLAREDGLRNIAFECADAQVHRFPDHRFDLAISRFGTMFFGDPVAAFTNIGRALHPAGRLVMMVWQAREHNEWQVAIDRILAAYDGTAAVDREAPDAVLTRRSERCDRRPASGRVRRRHVHRCPPTRLLRPRRGIRSRLDPWLHQHEEGIASGWINLPPSTHSAGCARRW